ncbi:MAG: double-strand break repair helicase AddA, partial [Beijerinckiaceae bacterium]
MVVRLRRGRRHMSISREIPAVVRKAQLSASDPGKSVWVSANAGSGKTHVLAQRVLRLLLAGVAPAKILCLTFTKAAAANMAVKVFATLSKWTQIDDVALAASIEEIGIVRPDAATLTFARRLFARTVETPGGLKIHTIHAFCERLLHLFPFEANVPGSFEVVQDLEQAELLNDAKQKTLGAAEKDRGALGAALQRLVNETTQDNFGALLREAVSHREWFRQASPEDFVTALRRALGLAAGDSIASIETEMIEEGIAPKRWRDFADFLSQGSKTDCDRAALFLKAADIYESAKDSSPFPHAEELAKQASRSTREKSAKPSPFEMPPSATPQDEGVRTDCVAAYLGIFFTKAGEPQKKLVTKNLAMVRPDFVAQLDSEQARLVQLCERRKVAACFERTIALATVIREILSNYERAKAVRGLLDFDDLISRTLRLLQRSDARWVLFKLDSGIDHILVDEAQDTSEAQWKILEELTGEFAAGLGGNERPRTFFAVGDEKQSIFSFQGAAPHMFHQMRKLFERGLGSDVFQHIELKTSFRSVPAILDMVDAVFGCAEHQQGLVSSDKYMGHDALKHDLPGLIEIWQPIATKEEEAPGDWRLPLDLLDESDPANKLAQRVAQKISRLIAPGPNECVFDSDLNRFRPVGAGDILILVRSRGPFFEAVIRALKQHKVPVAGADRLQLTEHIAVMDLMAAGRVALLLQDDLTLASVLKSPLIGLDDDDLLKLAPGRAGSLFEALAQSGEKRHQQACETLTRWRGRAALSPFQFYARLLSGDGGRRAMEARLGAEAC